MRIPKLILGSVFVIGVMLPSYGTDILVGATSVDITPRTPVALMGQFRLRIAEEIHTPLSVNIIAIQSGNLDGESDTAIFVSCDLVYIPRQVIALVRKGVQKRFPGFNTHKIILSATHTHTSPVVEDSTDNATFLYKLPTNITQVSEYRTFLVAQIVSGIVEAWNTKSKGQVTWGTRRAAIPYNRRVVYTDGEAKMYGKVDDPAFDNLEGYEDHDVHALFFWNAKDELIATSIEVACPAQEVEGDSRVDADYWHPVREKLKETYGSQLVVAGWIGAAGDQSPHPIYRKPALQRMVELSGVSRLDDIAERIVEAVTSIYQTVRKERYSDLVFEHKTAVLELPMRIITVSEYLESKRISHEAFVAIREDPDTAASLNTRMTWYGDIVKRFEAQKMNPNPQYETEIHVLRLGDIAICTNQFELFTDYGIQIQARSKALQTIVIQLAGPGTYLPTAKAISGGGYSAVCQSNSVGAEGGKILVEETLALLNGMWR
ncbi:MAG: hypothetical protein HKN76_05570 [Saprospiraceae bacterium]|nr:hypothetical protein [Saprospiraceae bacterium]